MILLQRVSCVDAPAVVVGDQDFVVRIVADLRVLVSWAGAGSALSGSSVGGCAAYCPSGRLVRGVS